MFPTEVQAKVLRAELARELEQNVLDQLARSHEEHPSIWSRLRQRMIAIEQQQVESTPVCQEAAPAHG